MFYKSFIWDSSIFFNLYVLILSFGLLLDYKAAVDLYYLMVKIIALQSLLYCLTIDINYISLQ